MLIISHVSKEPKTRNLIFKWGAYQIQFTASTDDPLQSTLTEILISIIVFKTTRKSVTKHWTAIKYFWTLKKAQKSPQHLLRNWFKVLNTRLKTSIYPENIRKYTKVYDTNYSSVLNNCLIIAFKKRTGFVNIVNFQDFSWVLYQSSVKFLQICRIFANQATLNY